MQKIKTYTYLTLLLLIWAIPCLHAQKKTKKRFAIPIEHFREKYESKDSIGFLIYEGDTLIRVNHYKAPKGVRVPYENRDSTFLSIYKKLAFRPSHKDSSDSKPMKYWKNEIKIYFSSGISKSTQKSVMDFANKISEVVDSLKINKVKTIENSNYIIYYDSDYEYLNSQKSKKYSDYWLTWNSKNQIDRCYLRIKKDQMFSEKLAQNRIKELFFGTLGWFNLSDELDCENYSSNCYSDTKHLTKIDLEILKYHYSYGICKGTRLKTFEAQHNRCQDLIKEGKSPGMFIHTD